ncbi:acyltransferase [Vibrio tapetis subsp. quintayensis]|uniref:acyltransferase n=1 Tax=Vibrio tapetis TaxID=52443 RepID=UPI0025B4A6C0|nr:acyltransferase [Vibrio tapetis]MDN3679477.1 acyltransferase [Vibrio tapetis subsp. quintayensis]
MSTLGLCFNLSLCFIRGLLHGYPLVFIGKGVTLRSKNNIRIGSFTRIEDFVELDGFGTEGISIGSYCKVGKYSIMRVPSAPHVIGTGIIVGDRTTFAEYCFVGGAGKVNIGTDNSIGQYVSIHPQNHSHSNGEKQSKLHNNTGTTEEGIIIGSNVWIGAKVTILDGSKISDFSTVAAMSLTRSEFKSHVLIAGIPAIIKKELTS